MSVTVTLMGPAPWGFRITGGRDFRKPITVSKVTEQSKAAAGDLRLGDVIVSINGESTAEMLNVEAQNKIKQSSGQLQLLVDRSLLFSPNQTNGESSPEVLATRFQDAMRTRDDSQSSLRSSYSSPASLSPRPGSPFLPTSPGLQTSSPYIPLQPSLGSEGRAELVTSRSFQSLASPASISEDRSPLPHMQCLGSRQEWGSLGRPNCSPVAVLPPFNRTPSPRGFTAHSPWDLGKDPGRSSPSYSPRNSVDSETAMRRLEEDSEVYKMIQENRELRAAPRQSSTFRLLQEALETNGGEGTATPFPSHLSPSAHKPVCSSVAGVQKLHTCEKCGNSIATQAVRIQEGRYRHPSCYVCTDCGLNLKMRGHFWVGEEMYCEKHARQRYQGPGAGATALCSKS
ncbi:PDZ and LIM domain protein 2 [Alligator mississippiensis]|uniref:PDZ and LIM domain protein 2 n=1 Tax=Alligator mississippiensis TaxID=8496 RepID=UPI0028774DD0|nr:PDZ and LIM domain protein 2 [Alligator mississippiensis]XP_059586705.1 PDZ and LIM domain protein 2 [Alligator mississippiensis]